MTRFPITRQLAIKMLLIFLFSVQSLAFIVSSSATFDEVQNFGLGKYLLQKQRWDVMGAITHPPLVYYLTSLPLFFVNEDRRAWEYEPGTDRTLLFLGGVDVVRGQMLLSAPENAHDRLLIWSRLTILLLSLVMGLYIYRFSDLLYGEAGAVLALTLFTFCPNMLAFSGIGTQDMPSAFFFFVGSYYFWKFLHNQRALNAVICGVMVGMAIAAKLNAFLLFPIWMLLYLVFQFNEGRRVSYHPAIIVAVAALTVFICYGFHLTPLIQTIELLKLEMAAGQASFWHGKLSNQGWWYFYPATFLIKTPLPVILLFLMALWFIGRNLKQGWLKLFFLLIPICAVFLSCCFSNFAIGIRYLLPIYPFMFVIIGSLATASKQVRMLSYAMVGWLAIATLHISPDYLSYFNETVGGANNGYKYLVDSNLDWGQGLKQLKKFMDDHGVKRISLSYFGADSPQRYGIEYDWLPSHHLYNPRPDEPYRLPQNQLLAISATNLQGVYLPNPDEFKWLRTRKPIARISNSIFIYDLSKPD